ncbi:hypothetical protein GCM10023231_13800 [Olivibacter ginsenosidimutans]|uniref:3-oxoacyl-ACP synthase n=1 Tax=Olivibacter ginsenosidimutans TaxID=1176537 RepID=A0ABP9AY37_9SPHI
MNAKKENIKNQLYQMCEQAVTLKITEAERALLDAREVVNHETKSSAGDKYETTREMMQQEIRRIEQQLLNAKQLKQQLLAIDYNKKSGDQVQIGSYIETSNGNFLLGIALGSVSLEHKTYFIISPVSPLGKLLLGKKIGAAVLFNNRSYQILTIV